MPTGVAIAVPIHWFDSLDTVNARPWFVYDPPDGPVGTATSQTPLGECVMEFAHDAAAAELTLTLVKKPWLLPEGVLWSGFTATLDRCRDTT